MAKTKAPKVIPFKQPSYRKNGEVAMETEARKGRGPSPVAVATFEDGEQVRMSFWSHKDGALDWPRARVVCGHVWRKREAERLHPMPAIKDFSDSKGAGPIVKIPRARYFHQYKSLMEEARVAVKRRQIECLDNVTAPAITHLYEEQTGEVCPL